MISTRACPTRMHLLSALEMFRRVFVVGLVVLCTRVRAQTVLPIAPEPVGSGARALGQSAFIAVADDATAASWNPAGLINLEAPEASFVGVGRTVTNDLSSNDQRVALHGESWSEGEINFMSYAQPLAVGGKDAVISVNYHQVYDLGLEYGMSGSAFASKITSKGAISAYSVAGGLSVPFHPRITVGASVNWYAASVINDYVREVKMTRYVYASRTTTETVGTLDDISGRNFTFGVLWDAHERDQNLLTLGFVCHTPFTAEVDQRVVDFDAGGVGRLRSRARLDVDFPLSLGAGANYRFSDRRSVAFDVQWTDWSDYSKEYTGGTSSPKDAVAVRLGFECLNQPESTDKPVRALRGGVFYEPRPAWDDILPVYGFSLGLGWTVKESFSLDFAYQFRWGEGEDFTVNRTSFDYGVEEHWFIGSVVTYF